MFKLSLASQPKLHLATYRTAQPPASLRVRPDPPARAHRLEATGSTVDATSSNGATVAQAPTEQQKHEEHEAQPAPGTRRASPRINVIKGTRWEKGIPPVMGAHLMASGTKLERGRKFLRLSTAFQVACIWAD